jgi:tRNA-intron endonuclease
MFEGQLVDNRIIVWDIEESRSIFGSGYYGKPLGVPKPKGIDFDAPLVLDLIEGYYLEEKGRLKVHRTDESVVSSSEIRRICRKQYSDFDTKYAVFQDLRDRGYIVTPGIKFGCDFAVYERGPGIDHAPYLVQVYRSPDVLTATGTVLAGRLATTVKKQFILAIPRVRSGKVDYVGLDWWRA